MMEDCDQWQGRGSLRNTQTPTIIIMAVFPHYMTEQRIIRVLVLAFRPAITIAMNSSEVWERIVLHYIRSLLWSMALYSCEAS